MMKLTREVIGTGAVAAVAIGIILTAGCASTPYQQSAGEYIDSRTIGTKVKAALLEDPQVKGLDVNVDVWKDEVQLNGFVDNAEQKARSETLAWNVTGVKNVHNNLVVKERMGTDAGIGSAPGAENATARDAEVIFARILANPSYYYGKEAALAGKVNVVFSPNAFTLGSPSGVSDRELLVLAPRESVERVVPSDKVRVEGTLELFNRAAAEERLGRALRDEEFAQWNDKPVLFVDSISKWGGGSAETVDDRTPGSGRP